MGEKSGPADEFFSLDTDSDGKSTLKFFKELDKRAKAYKRQLAYSLSSDLLELVKSKIPRGGQYGKLSKSLKIAEGRDGTFAVMIDSRASNLKRTDTSVTLIYIKARRIQDRIRPEIKILQDYSPWTVDTLPFWPDRRQALIVQRKVSKKIVDKIGKAKETAKNKVNRQLAALGQKDITTAMSKRVKDMRKAKAIPDVAFEMMTLEFGGGSQRGQAIWRSSLKELFPGRMKTISTRYKKLQKTLGDSRDNTWRSWPLVNDKVKSRELAGFTKFQKQLGY